MGNNLWCSRWCSGDGYDFDIGSQPSVLHPKESNLVPNNSNHVTSEVLSSPFPQTPPLLFKNCNSLLLSPVQMLEIRRALPRSLRHSTWNKAFSFEEDAAASLDLLHDKLKGERAVLVVLRINDGSLVGGLAVVPDGWRMSRNHSDFFGSSDSFLFSLPPATTPRSLVLHNNSTTVSAMRLGLDVERNVIPASSFYEACCEGVVCSTSDVLAFGRGGSHALWIDADLTCGGSGFSSTFGNTNPLTKPLMFDILGMEAWVFSSSSPANSSSLEHIVSSEDSW